MQQIDVQSNVVATVSNLADNGHSTKPAPTTALAEVPTGSVFSERQLEDQ